MINKVQGAEGCKFVSLDYSRKWNQSRMLTTQMTELPCKQLQLG